MTAAAVGSIVGLHYDSPNAVGEGDVIQTGTGRVYRVVSVRQQERGKHAGRWHLQAKVIHPSEVSPSDWVHELRWYRR